jgi:ribosomal protein S27E
LKFTIKLRSKRRNSKGEIRYKSFDVEAESREEAVEKVTTSDEMTGFKLWEVHQEFPKKLLKKVEIDECGNIVPYEENSNAQKMAVFCSTCGVVAFYFVGRLSTNVICPKCGRTLIEKASYKT